MTDIKLTNAHIMFGDALERLKELPDNSVDSVVTDPPYGLSDNKYVATTIEKWILGERTFIPDGKGFMGKAWDSFVPPPAIWDECMRVLKPGGHLLAFFGSRTQDIGALSIRLAGFEIRDSIAWVYGSGFPKSMNISLQLDKQAGLQGDRGTAINVGGKGERADIETSVSNVNGKLQPPYNDFKSDAAKQYAGWGTALKPAVEPIVVARKPLSEKTVANNVLKWGTGGLNIDASRVGTTGKDLDRLNNEWDREWNTNYSDYAEKVGGSAGFNMSKAKKENAGITGRFPANIILGHTEDCEATGEVITDDITLNGEGNDKLFHGNFNGGQDQKPKQATTAVYKCVDGCPVKELNEQSGVSKSGKASFSLRKASNSIGTFKRPDILSYTGFGDSGGASRFFYVAKASKKDRNEGLEGLDTKGKIFNGQNPVSAGKAEGSVEDKFTTQPAQNFHPTVKPTTLMEYLIKLVTPEGGTVLDPFTGSGSTGKAALLNGFKFIGCELTEEYLPIIEGRLKFAENKYSEQQAKQAETLFDIEGEE